jgi:hypothetical protein
MGKKIVRLTESDLARIIERVINEAKGDTKCDTFFKEIFEENLKNSNNGWNCYFKDYNTITCKHKEKSPFMVEKYCGDPNEEYDYGFKIYDGDGEMFKKIFKLEANGNNLDYVVVRNDSIRYFI